MLQTYTEASACCPYNAARENGCVVLEFSNRYLSNAAEIGADRLQTFPTSWDPTGHLAKRITTEVFLSDNSVEYFERKATALDRWT